MLGNREPESLGSRSLTIIEEGVFIEGKIYSKG